MENTDMGYVCVSRPAIVCRQHIYTIELPIKSSGFP